jgi:hypothetical protein
MGTRALTLVVEYLDNKTIAQIYSQYDGYVEGVGCELAAFLKDKRLVNGIGKDTKNIANGMGCLAAQLIAHLKVDAGMYYLEAPDPHKDILDGTVEYASHIDFLYIIKRGEVEVYCSTLPEDYVDETDYDEVKYEWKELFSGDYTEYYNYCTKCVSMLAPEEYLAL